MSEPSWSEVWGFVTDTQVMVAVMRSSNRLAPDEQIALTAPFNRSNKALFLAAEPLLEQRGVYIDWSEWPGGERPHE